MLDSPAGISSIIIIEFFHLIFFFSMCAFFLRLLSTNQQCVRTIDFSSENFDIWEYIAFQDIF